MKNKGKVLFLVLISIPNSYALFGSDTAMLVELVGTTASQLNELEKLVTSSENYTRQLRKYNELAQDEYFRAQRVLYIAEELAAKKEAQDLGQLNVAIRELKYSMSEMKSLMNEYALIKGEEKSTKAAIRIEGNLNKTKLAIAEGQVEHSLSKTTNGRANQLTSQNTALLYEQSVNAHNTQLEILAKVSTTNRLLAEELEDKRLKEIEKNKNYGVAGK